MTSHPLPQPSHDPGSMRVSDADRDLVTQVLNSAYAEGRITHDELDERMDLVLASKTFNDLRPITADLMPSPMTEQYATRPAGMVNPVESTGTGLVVLDDPAAGHTSDTITAIMATRRREPGWQMPRRTSINVVMGDAILDLRGGVMQARECEINVNCVMGDVKLHVPDGVIVIDRTTSVMGDITVKGMRPAPVGSPTITITGFVMMADVKVYGPDHESLGVKLGLTKKK
ncbi:DUF1707 SHOCT-like domain-containing protein [Aestuariimicrobium ganziense]|uniref:DUF1707 SHOCT-like domain-containing protein n=1 Tax=Aestuariimicrobium ganziense TaxID=2773677 RepID=UPI00194585C8|nr:DUF1707 domain-containing protein [Aestuariimicrobium ganziense]